MAKERKIGARAGPIRESGLARAVEIAPDGWERFERAVDVVVKSPPQQRKTKTKKGRKAKAKASKR